MWSQYNDYARQLLTHFVHHLSELYGSSVVGYSVHNLIHLADVGPVIFRFKKAIFRFKKSEIPFRFRFIIGKVEFDKITIIFIISKESEVNGPTKWHN